MSGYIPDDDEATLDCVNITRDNSFKLILACEMVIKEPEYLIDDILETDSLGSLFGEPSAGKSFVALSMACSVATGAAWFGHSVKKMPVIYIAGEGHNGLARRRAAWQKGNDCNIDADCPLYFSTVPARMTDEEHVKSVIDSVNGIAENHGPPGLIVIDTLARNFGGEDENSTQAMNEFVTGCDSLRSTYNATVLVVHHSGHADKGRGRGSSVFRGALDIEYAIVQEMNVIRQSNTKLKDGAKPDDLFFRLNDCFVGCGESGRPITSAYLVKTDEPAHAMPLGENQKTAVTLLASMYKEREENLVAREMSPSLATVKVEEFKNELKAVDIARQRISELIRNDKLFQIVNGTIKCV